MITIKAVKQPRLFVDGDQESATPVVPNSRRNYVLNGDAPIHNWYRFVLSYPPHLVRTYLEEFGLGSQNTVLDPFCGTGTTLVEARSHGIKSVGIEANPVAQFISKTKLNWDIDPDEFERSAQSIAQNVQEELKRQGIDDLRLAGHKPHSESLLRLPPETEKLLIKDSISEIPLHKALLLRRHLQETLASTPYYDHALVALAKTLVFRSSNLNFGPEVGVGKIKEDAPVIAPWTEEIRSIANDIRALPKAIYPEALVILGDSREIGTLLKFQSVDAIITSPPYPNEKDYSRTTRLESVLLEFMTNRQEMRDIKRQLLRSNTRGVYKTDDDDVSANVYPEVVRLSEKIEQRRIELGKTSGFEKLYARVTRLYFGGMAKHLSELSPILKPGARLAYVVGDQASYFQVMIRTGEILAQIAEHLGYKVERIDLFRTRLATATGEQLREEVLVLRWPGADKSPT